MEVQEVINIHSAPIIQLFDYILQIGYAPHTADPQGRGLKGTNINYQNLRRNCIDLVKYYYQS